MKAFVVGTAGHVDHGKTALVRALTGVETDRWEEEKRRGLTIDIGFARLPVEGDVEIGVVDVPGHEDFVKNMLAGATGVDLLLLVIAADEGPMPQTREHLTIAHALGVDQGVVALSKVDRVEEEWVALAREAVEEELRLVLGHARWPILSTSATEGTGVERVRSEIRARAGEAVRRQEGDVFRLPVDRSFTLPGAGTVVTGTAWSGAVEVGDEVRVLPRGKRSRIRSLEVHGERRDRVAAGRRCAMALTDVDPHEAPRGSSAVGGEGWRTVRRFGARLRVPGHSPRALENGQRVRVYLGTREAMARLELPGEAIEPGSSGWARVFLEEPVVARARDRFVVRFYSPVVTVGGGAVAELEPPDEWASRTTAWEEVLDAAPLDAFRAVAELSGQRGATAAGLPIVTGLSLEVLRELRRDTPAGMLREGERWFSESAMEEVKSSLLASLREIHSRERRAAAASLEALRSSAGGEADGDLVDGALRELREEGALVVEGPEVRLPSHEPSLTPEERSLKRELLARIERGGLAPPTVDRLGRELDLEEDTLHDLLELLSAEERVVALNSDIYVSRARAREARRAARRLLADKGEASASEFKDMYGVTRKYLIPILEYLDRTGTTRRTGSGRVLRGEAEAEAEA